LGGVARFGVAKLPYVPPAFGVAGARNSGARDQRQREGAPSLLASGTLLRRLALATSWCLAAPEGQTRPVLAGWLAS